MNETEINRERKPSDYLQVEPMNSVFQKSEAETIMRNILIILRNVGNEWRELSFKEYKAEREKNGNFSDAEQPYFEQVVDYAHPERIGLFCPKYKEIWKRKI